MQLLLCGGHIQPIAAGVARVKAAAVAYHNRKLFAHVFTLLFLPGIFGDSCRLLLLRGFFALYGVVRHEHTVYFEIVGVLLRDRRGDFRKQAVIRFDTPIQILSIAALSVKTFLSCPAIFAWVLLGLLVRTLHVSVHEYGIDFCASLS